MVLQGKRVVYHLVNQSNKEFEKLGKKDKIYLCCAVSDCLPEALSAFPDLTTYPGDWQSMGGLDMRSL